MPQTTETETGPRQATTAYHAGLQDGQDAARYDPPAWGERDYARGYERGFNRAVANYGIAYR